MTQITFITGYFELLNTGRNFDVYLERASKMTLKISNPLVIFCEPHTYPKIKAERDKYGYLTHYIIKRFNEMEFYSYLPQIIENRKTHPRADSRNIPEYQIATCSKFTMIRDAINKNIFGSLYYAWIDFSLAESKFTNIDILRTVSNNIISNKLEKIKMCFINYTPKNETLDLQKYYNLHGRGGISGGFYSGSSDKLLKFAELCITFFKNNVSRGYGHADEQIYLQVYFANESKDLFNFYFGDYQYVISNFIEVNTESKHIILNVFLPNVIKDKHILESNILAKNAVMFLINGYKKGKVELNKDEIVKLFSYIA